MMRCTHCSNSLYATATSHAPGGQGTDAWCVATDWLSVVLYAFSPTVLQCYRHNQCMQGREGGRG